jgi:hypothetical protein
MSAFRLVGSDGNCSVSGYKLKFNSWSMSMSQVVTDTSALGDTFSAKRGGLMSGTFSASGTLFANESNSSPVPHAGDPSLNPVGQAIALSSSAVAFTAYAGDFASVSNDSLWSGNLVVSSFVPSVSNAGEATATIDGETSGDISINWDES